MRAKHRSVNNGPILGPPQVCQRVALTANCSVCGSNSVESADFGTLTETRSHGEAFAVRHVPWRQLIEPEGCIYPPLRASVTPLEALLRIARYFPGQYPSWQTFDEERLPPPTLTLIDRTMLNRAARIE